MRKAFGVLLLGGLLLLLLSALVVTEADACLPEADVLPARTQPVLMMPASVAAAQQTDASVAPSTPVRALCLLALAGACCLPAFHAHDANGRVLTAGRYENSVYQVFRAEVAGG